MKKIDRDTVQRIIDAADIVEVVSDFVTLKKRGANYIGLCPFHNERTPSFSVSKAKGICKCFSCGKGGSAINFIMEHEQMTYNEALRYLAKKYHIEIKEREMTEEEQRQSTERESLIAVNDFAMKHFEHNMLDTSDGRDIGLAYFRERGINDPMVQKFHLGYAIDRPDDLYNAAMAKGFSEKYLLDTGLCAKSERGTVYDRFKGRVIYPVFSVSGRVIAFGGRTLRKDKNVAKYVNSPESIIYRKSYELYGLYQAKASMQKHDKCILVEGYMDVISMHQVGVDYVVASSGTSLTEGQIRLIHRFTRNVTVIYDSDAAGIKASLRGIDLLLAEGMNIKVLLLPDGEDPDSFAQSHSATEVEEYIAKNETDFMRFKTRILLNDAGEDPIKRAEVISSIVRSIAVIPDQVTQAVYLKECSRMLDIEEKVLALELTKREGENLEKDQKTKQLQQAQNSPVRTPRKNGDLNERLRQREIAITKYIVKYGFLPIAGEIDDPATDVSVLDYIQTEMDNDEIEFTDPACRKIYYDALSIRDHQWSEDRELSIQRLMQQKTEERKKGLEEIRLTAKDMAEIEAREHQLEETCNAKFTQTYIEETSKYLEDVFLNSPDDEERQLATTLASDKYRLSKVHTKYTHVETEQERLTELVERSVWELKFAILDIQINELNQAMKEASAQSDNARVNTLMTQIFELYQLKAQFAKFLGERIVNPK